MAAASKWWMHVAVQPIFMCDHIWPSGEDIYDYHDHSPQSQIVFDMCACIFFEFMHAVIVHAISLFM